MQEAEDAMKQAMKLEPHDEEIESMLQDIMIINRRGTNNCENEDTNMGYSNE